MRSINYNKLVPPDSFIGRYMQHMSSQETATAYDFWCACWLISLALGRGITVPRPRAPVYMNMYTILVAESGTTRKSSAVRIATKIARAFIAKTAEEQDEHTDLIENKITPESLELRLVEASRDYNSAHMVISISELVTFFGREKYTMALPGLLTDLYDSPSLKSGGGTVTRRSTEIKNVFVNFLSASTPAWLSRAINPDVIEGGFTSRTLFIVSEKRKAHIAWPESKGDEQAFEQQCVDFLSTTRRRTKIVRELAMRGDALEQFRKWYTRREDSSDPFRSSFESREDSHVLRLAGILAVNADQWAIRPIDIETAAKVIKQVKEDGATIFIGGGDTKLIQGVAHLRERLISAGIDGIDQTALFFSVRNQLSSVEYRTALAIMHELELVQQFIAPKEMGRPATIWRATKALASNSSTTEVVGRMV